MAITTYLKSKKDLCKKLIKSLLEKYPYASILGVDTTGVVIRCDNFNTRVSESNEFERGFVVKVYDGKGYIEYSFNELNEDNIDEVSETIKNIEINESNRVNAKMLEDEKITESFSRVDESPMTCEEIISKLSTLREEINSKSDLIINTVTLYDKMNVSKMFISNNKDLEQDYSWTNVLILPIVRKDDNIKNARASAGGINTKECFDKVTNKVEETVNLAIGLLDSLPITPGIYDVITDPSITGLIAHEAFGHGVEMDMIVKNRAKSKDYFGKRVASPLVNMRDGAKSGFCVASYFFDDDGVLGSDTELIKDGILINGMSDALSAMQLGTKPTGNGRRESFTHKAYTRMTNTFFVPGKDKLEDMIKSIDYGFYLCETNNGMEDPKNWQIQCVCEYAREIKDGKFTGRLFSPVILSGYVLDLLESITMVSDAFELFGEGYCGKGHKEWVRVSDGGPHLKARVKLG